MTDHTLVAPDWLSAEGMQTLSSGYLLPGETPRMMMERISSAAAKYNEDINLEKELFHCLWNGWIGCASPVAANFGSNRALPISCYSVHLSDSTKSIYSHLKEVALLSKNGGGVGVYFGDIRPAGSPIKGGGVTGGKLGWLRGYDLTAQVVSQGGDLRKGSFALYENIEAADYPEMLRAKDHTKGDPRLWIDSNLGAVISNSFMENMIENGGHNQWLFGETIRTRLMSGSPYMLFIDNVNTQNPQCYVERGLNVSTSNLCSEITLYTDENHSFVCVLSSMNLSRWFEWKDWKSPLTGRSAPQIAVHLLEAVVTEFIRKADKQPGMGRSVRFARKSRALGLGTMGLHSLYQSQMLPFKSEGARALNIEVHKFIQEEAKKASAELADRWGEPEWCEGSGMRHTHLTAIAPTKTNSVISGAYSEGISPMDYNYYVAKQDKGTFVRKNPHLEKLFCERGVPDTVWDDINRNQGSVQFLEFLSQEEKEVFKTAREIDQFELIKQAGDRQPYVCQGQSLNIWVDPHAPAEYLLRLHIYAWKMKVKALYYLKSKSALIAKQNEMDDDIEDPAIVITKADCPYCTLIKDQLRKDGTLFTEVNVEVAKQTGMWADSWKTVPQLYVDNRWIGGYDSYMEYRAQSKKSKTFTIEENNNECTACHA